MNNRLLTPMTGFILSYLSFETWQNVLFSILVAFLGGIAAWLGKKLCEIISNKFKSKETKS